jgi:hypothetical protein
MIEQAQFGLLQRETETKPSIRTPRDCHAIQTLVGLYIKDSPWLMQR